MKIIYIILTITFTLVSCSENDENLSEPQEVSLIGQWQLIEVFLPSGNGTDSWNTIDNGYTYNFNANTTFTSDRFSECDNGFFIYKDNLLTLDYSCEGFTTGIESPEGTFIENISFDGGNMILVPTYKDCTEGCGWKFRKVSGE